jgi:hypothetical protein
VYALTAATSSCRMRMASGVLKSSASASAMRA